jgi:hypothetical protein
MAEVLNLNAEEEAKWLGEERADDSFTQHS